MSPRHLSDSSNEPYDGTLPSNHPTRMPNEAGDTVEMPEDVLDEARAVAHNIKAMNAEGVLRHIGLAIMKEREMVDALKEALDEATTVLHSMADHASENGHVIEAMYARNIANLYGKPRE